jgi:integrase
MSIKKQKNGKWLCQIDRKGMKRVRRSFETQKEAEIFERDYLFGQYQQKKSDINDPRTLIELIEIWFRYHGINLAEPDKLKRRLLAAAEAMGNPVGHMLTPELFVAYRYKRMVKAERPVSGKTMNNQLSELSAVYNKLKSLKIIDYDNPIADVEKLKLQQVEMGFLSHSQIVELLNNVKANSQNESTWWVINLCVRTGARWSEAENLRVKHLQPYSVTYSNTKSKKIRTVKLEPSFYDELIKFAGNKPPESRIFDPCYNSCRKALHRLQETQDLNLPDGQLTHVFRHSFGAHYMMNGGKLHVLKDILGHSDIKMTERYIHFSPDFRNEAVLFNPLSAISKEQQELAAKSGG